MISSFVMVGESIFWLSVVGYPLSDVRWRFAGNSMAFEQAAVKKHKAAFPDALVDCASRAEDADIISRIQRSVRRQFQQKVWSPKEATDRAPRYLDLQAFS